jgi:hypothetical protein
MQETMMDGGKNHGNKDTRDDKHRRRLLGAHTKAPDATLSMLLGGSTESCRQQTLHSYTRISLERVRAFLERVQCSAGLSQNMQSISLEPVFVRLGAGQ